MKRGDIPERDMFNTFNMGIGMDIIVKADDADTALEILKGCGEEAYIIGEVVKADKKLILY